MLTKYRILFDHWLRNASAKLFYLPIWKQFAVVLVLSAAAAGFCEWFQCRTGYYQYQIAKRQVENVQQMNRLATSALSTREATVELAKSARALFKKRDAVRSTLDPNELKVRYSGTDLDVQIDDLHTKMLVYFDRERFRWTPHPQALDVLSLAIMNTQLQRLPGGSVRH